MDVSNLAWAPRLFGSQKLKYRIYLTLPRSTVEITNINFTAFQIKKDGGEETIKCTASQVQRS